MKRFFLAAAFFLCASTVFAGGYIMDSRGNVTFFNGSGRVGSIVQSNGNVLFYNGIRPRPVFPIYGAGYSPYYAPYFGPPAPPAPPSPWGWSFFGW